MSISVGPVDVAPLNRVMPEGINKHRHLCKAEPNCRAFRRTALQHGLGGIPTDSDSRLDEFGLASDGRTNGRTERQLSKFRSS